MPKRRCKSCLDFGKGMALFFSRSGETPFSNTLCPKNVSFVVLFSFKPDLRILFKTYSVQVSN